MNISKYQPFPSQTFDYSPQTLRRDTPASHSTGIVKKKANLRMVRFTYFSGRAARSAAGGYQELEDIPEHQGDCGEQPEGGGDILVVAVLPGNRARLV